MRQWAKSNVTGLDNPSVLRDLIQKQDVQLHELSAAVKLLGLGRVPTATNTTVGGGVTDHGLLTGLADDDHTQYLLLAGRSSGQTVYGGITSTENLFLYPNAATAAGASGTIYCLAPPASVTPSIKFSIARTTAHAATAQAELSNNGIWSAIRVFDMNTYGIGGGCGDLALFRTRAGNSGVGPFFTVDCASASSSNGNPMLRIYNSEYLDIGNQTIKVTCAQASGLPAVQVAAANKLASNASNAVVTLALDSRVGQTGDLTQWRDSSLNTLAAVTVNGYFNTPRLQLMDAAGNLLTIVPATATTAHTLTMPGAQGGASTFLQNDGSGNLSWATAGGGGAHAILSTAHSDAVASAVSRGSLIYGNATPAWDELAVGTANTVLVSNGTDVSWSAISSAHITNRTRILFLPPDVFGTAARSLLGSNPNALETLNTAGAAESYWHTNFSVPADYVSGANWTVHWAAITQATASAWTPRLQVRKLNSAVVTSVATADTAVTATIASAAYTHMQTSGFTLPDSQTYAANELWRLTFWRPATSDAGDTYNNNVHVLGIQFSYVADM